MLKFEKAGPRPKKPREKHTDNLSFIASLSCCSCGHPPNSECHHLKRHTQWPKRNDRLVTPLCVQCHRGHGGVELNGNEIKWFASKFIYDPIALAIQLYEYGLENKWDEAEELVTRKFRNE